MNDEFYLGWEDKAPPGIGQRARRAAALLLTAAVILGGALALAQRTIGVSVFEWGKIKDFTGTLRSQPYPHLLVPRPGVSSRHTLQSVPSSPENFSSYYLVGPFKFGLDPVLVAALDGKSVNLKGTLIYRGGQTMIEVVADSLKPTKAAGASADAPEAASRVSLGRHTLVGEIVDSKCYLGVMNPGALAPHRACAIRCISGGIPPVLLVRQTNAPALYFLLVSPDGKQVNKQVLRMIAEPVAITGDIERQRELLILRSDPATYRRATL